jgi:hypothetical protein
MIDAKALGRTLPEIVRGGDPRPPPGRRAEVLGPMTPGAPLPPGAVPRAWRLGLCLFFFFWRGGGGVFFLVLT